MWERINAIITWIYELRFMRAYGRYGWARDIC
ncbi:Uncharacterised protein [Arcanobacterium haemolyticum]|nr:Uncharacterised protein [Arcanobacterium haemolyticum]